VVLPHFLWSKPKIEGRNFRLLRLYAMPGIGSTQSEGEPHIQRLWLPQTSLRPVQRLVRSLRQEELIEPRYWYGRSPRRRAPPIRRGRLWALTKSGRRLIHEHDQ
jgi:hypothetical protein